MDEFDIQLTKPRFMLATCIKSVDGLKLNSDYLLDRDSFKITKSGCTCDVYDIEYRSDKGDYDILFVGKKLGNYNLINYINFEEGSLNTDSSMRLILEVKSNIEKAIFTKLLKEN